MTGKDALIVVSGGMDSVTLLYDMKDSIAMGVSFDYGSNHNAREIPLAEMHCRRLGIPHVTINLGFMHQHFKSSLLEGADAIPEGHYADANMKSTVVPFRNGIMLAIAVAGREQRAKARVAGQPWWRPCHLSRLQARVHRGHGCRCRGRHLRGRARRRALHRPDQGRHRPEGQGAGH